MKTYTVTYIIKRNRSEYCKAMEVTAANAKLAREEFFRRYFSKRSDAPHPFRIKITLKKAPSGDSDFSLDMTLCYFVRFNNPALNAHWEFVRGKSTFYGYGNKTSVMVSRDGNFVDIVDTRYDTDVVKDFDFWCRKFLKNNLDPAYEPKIEAV